MSYEIRQRNESPLYVCYPDDHACGSNRFYAEYTAVPAERVDQVPEVLDLRQAGAVPTTGLTALQGIDDTLHLKKDESIIIHGASGGVGTLAVQFARLRGAHVFATASGNQLVRCGLRCPRV